MSNQPKGTILKDYPNYIFLVNKVWSIKKNQFLTPFKHGNATVIDLSNGKNSKIIKIELIPYIYHHAFDFEHHFLDSVILPEFPSYQILSDGKIWSKKGFRFLKESTISYFHLKNDNKTLHLTTKKAQLIYQEFKGIINDDLITAVALPNAQEYLITKNGQIWSTKRKIYLKSTKNFYTINSNENRTTIGVNKTKKIYAIIQEAETNGTTNL